MRLRRATATNAPAIQHLMSVEKVYRYLSDGVKPPPSIAEEWIRSAGDDETALGGGLWILQDANGETVVGLVRLSADEQEELELTYLLHPNLWGHGYATRIAHTVMTNAFGAGRVATIWAGADLPNGASIAVMKRLRMRFRREVRYPLGPGVEYEITREEFDPKRIEGLPIE